MCLASKERGWSTWSIGEGDKGVDHDLDGASDVDSPKHEEDENEGQHGPVDLRIRTGSQVIDRSGKYGYIEATGRRLYCQPRFLRRDPHITD